MKRIIRATIKVLRDSGSILHGDKIGVSELSELVYKRMQSSASIRKCLVPGCGNLHHAKDLCKKHYIRKLRYDRSCE